MAFLTPFALIGALLAVPIILLYMLRLRRREVVISSTFLWQQLLQDSEANTPWQRLRRNLLLLLQLVILAMLVLAIARPFIIVPAISTGRIALLLDASASMNSSDIEEGSRTRFDEAQRQALGIVDTMSGEDTMTVIRVAEVPEVLAPFTSDRNVLRAAINGARPSQASADWDAALTLAQAGAREATEFDLVIVGDGGLGQIDLTEIQGEVQYVRIGESGSNFAISALATGQLPGEPPQLFTQVTNYGDQDAEVLFSLRVDDVLVVADEYTIPAGSERSFVSEGLPEDFTVIQAGLTTPAESTVPDYLAEDNTAWAVSTGVGTRRALLMTPGNLFLEQLLRTLPSVEAFKSDVTLPMPTDEYDLYVFDSWLPDRLPDGDLLIINPPSDSAIFEISEPSKETDNPQVAREDPRMTFVDFANVHVLQFIPVTAAWATPLITVDGGPLLLAGEVDGRQVAIMTFDIHHSDLPLQIAWPILLANLMDWFTPRSVISAPNGLKVGDSLLINPPVFDADTVRITKPDGSERNLAVQSNTLIFADTATPGLYTLDVLLDEEVIQSTAFAVNLFDDLESNIAPREALQVGTATIPESEKDEIGQQEFWPLLALVALLVLLIEWYVYHQRMRVPTLFRPVWGQGKAKA